MYHPKVIEARRSRLATQFPGLVPPGGLREYSVEESEAWVRRLEDKDPTKAKKRGDDPIPLTKEESLFITNEIVMAKTAYEYWCERYCYINLQGSGLGKMYPLWESQKLLLAAIADKELEQYEREIRGEGAEGVLINILKARQLGASTISESAIGHRFTTQSHVFGLIAADVPEQSAYMFGMLERVVEGLPWWMRPEATDWVKNTEIAFSTGAHVWTAAGKSTRGKTEQRGNIGRGKTLSLLHLSELSTWDDPRQIDDALMPAVPYSARVLGFKESTAKGRQDWWHKEWAKSKRGISRFSAVFIPWYVEKSKHRRPVTMADWSPSEDTLVHAKRCEEDSPRWLKGTSVSLSREQLFWYETTKASYTEDGKLAKFLEEYPADDEEAFQNAGIGIFGVEVIEDIKRRSKAAYGVIEVMLRRELEMHGGAGLGKVAGQVGK